MSTTTTSTTPTPLPTDKSAVVSKLSLSVVTQLVFLAMMVIAYLTKDDKSLTLLTGAVIVNATTAVNYWFGSSAGSSAKDAAIAQLTPSTTVRTTTP